MKPSNSGGYNMSLKPDNIVFVLLYLLCRKGKLIFQILLCLLSVLNKIITFKNTDFMKTIMLKNNQVSFRCDKNHKGLGNNALYISIS